ncbi:MAG: sugar ABC transporter permease [Treponema sp.]|jgi:multiple sugar transport system permease protein|nr:sugar ABC transporter permease [Treponema sp.]
MRLIIKNQTFEKGELLSFLLILPALAVVAFVQIIPIGYGLFISLLNYNFGKINLTRDFVGLGNYIRMVQDPLVWRSLLVALEFTVMAIGGDVILGTIVSLGLHSSGNRSGKFLRPIITIPLLISPIIIGLIWRYMLDPLSGIIYWFLGLFGVGVARFPGLSGASTALFCTAMAHWWQVAPFVIIVISAGLAAIPNELYEAARIDGSGFMNTFFRITLPHLRHLYMVVIITAGVDTIKVYDIIVSLTGGGPNNATLSVTMYAFRRAFITPEMGYAMSIGILAMVVSFLVFGITFSRFNQKETEEY